MAKRSLRKLIRPFAAAAFTVGLVATASNVQAYQTQDLYVYYDAANTSSYNSAVSTSAWNDLSGNSRHGTISSPGSVTLDGGALTFPGGYTSASDSSPHVVLGGDFSNFSTGITIETEAHFGTNVGNWERIFDFGNGAESDNIWLGRYTNSDEIAIEIWRTESGVKTNYGRCKTAGSVNALATATFKKFTVTLDGSRCSFYIDGVQVDTEVDGYLKPASPYNFDVFYNDPNSLSSYDNVLPRTVARTKNYLGRSNWSSDAIFEGAVKYLRIYTTALSSQSVTNNSTVSTPSNTITYSTTGATSGTAPSPFTGSGSVTLASNDGSLAKTGYTFAGWATSANQTTAISNTYNLSSNVTLYPAFAPVIAGTPGTPTATISNTTASVSWAAPSTGATPFTYVVTSSPAGGTCTVSGTTASCTGLTGGTSYTFSVTASNTVGTSASSAASNSVTAVAVVVIPGTPGTPTATISNTTASVSWTAPGTGTAPFTYAVASTPSGATCTVTGTTASCTGLTAGTSYTFAVSATNSAGTSSASSSSNSVTATNAPVSQPYVPPAPALQLISPIGPGGSQSGPSSIIISPGKSQLLVGTGLDQVSTVRIGATTIPINTKSSSSLALQVPKGLSAGKYKIELLGTFGVISQENYFEVPKSVRSITASGFNPDAAKLNSQVVAKVSQATTDMSGVITVICDGSTSGLIATEFDRRLAKARAVSVCSAIAKANPTIKTVIKISPASGLGAKARNVKISILNY